METQARFTVDADHCERAAEELYAILRIQHEGFAERWNASRATRVVIGVARWVGLLGSFFGLSVVSALLYFDTREWAVQPSAWFIPAFVACFLFFVFTPWIVARLKRWSVGRAAKTARRQANRCMSQARRLAPFEAEFDFRGDLLLYLRGKEGVWQLAWSRLLGPLRARGIAVQGEHITAILRRPGSLAPVVLILQRDRDWTTSILQDVGITLRRFPLPDQRNS